MDKYTCTSWGDPHFETWNRAFYNFMGNDEYVLAKIGNLTVHARQRPLSNYATANKAVRFNECFYCGIILINDFIACLF